ncbi:septal ring lytic transglycosylase RlpA family protein [Nonomuraea terrae]|uniref:Probable endolytic peptidoglycan transglycosylase RlpA n=2 Tax=Nonomuraea terrae TaxID=2530383 RepID=A0A4R4YDK5_9ACTN|nr:septal ring lytic transglycosylase RlpA family protein [Nonomuraea terrae]
MSLSEPVTTSSPTPAKTARTTPSPAASPHKPSRRHSPAPSSPATKPSAVVAPAKALRSPQPTKSPLPAESPKAKAKTESPRVKAEMETAKKAAYTTRVARNEDTRGERRKPRFRVIASGSCGASYYGEGQMTASGERFDPSAMTAAHKTLPMGSRVRVTNPDNGESVTVRINDRGPFVGGRCLDLSEGAFAALGDLSAGVMHVKYQVLAR